MGRNTEKVGATLERAAASNYWTEAEARAVLEACEASGLSVAEFARRHGLGPQRLRWWKKRRAEETGPELSFVPVHVAPPWPEAQRAAGPASMEVVLAMGRTMFLHDLPPEVLADALAHGGPEQSNRPFADPWPLAAWPDVPTRVIAGLRDRLFPFEFLRSLSLQRLDIDPERIDSGHLVALARPRELVELLLNGNEGRVPRRHPG